MMSVNSTTMNMSGDDREEYHECVRLQRVLEGHQAWKLRKCFEHTSRTGIETIVRTKLSADEVTGVLHQFGVTMPPHIVHRLLDEDAAYGGGGVTFSQVCRKIQERVQYVSFSITMGEGGGGGGYARRGREGRGAGGGATLMFVCVLGAL